MKWCGHVTKITLHNMRKISILAVLLLISLGLSAQAVRYTGTVANWSPATAKDTTFKTNMYLTDDYQLGLSWDCESCDSVWIKLMWSNDAADSTYFSAPMYQSGSAVDSIFVNGDVQGGMWSDGTPYPYNRVDVNQVGGTKPSKLVIKRTITSKRR